MKPTNATLCLSLIACAGSTNNNPLDGDNGIDACTTSTDCSTGLCFDTGNGNVCTTNCTSDADCPSGQHCLDFTTDPEFQTRVCDGGTTGPWSGCEWQSHDPSCAVDPTCALPGGSNYLMPFDTLVEPRVPETCHNGFEINNPHPFVYEVNAKTAAGSQDIRIHIDFATYATPNRVIVRGVDADGQTYTLFDRCRMKTWDQEFTDPTSRPPDISIRFWRVDVKPGTTKLIFDFSDPGSTSEVYVRVQGLCDFNLVNPWASDPTRMLYWRTVN